MVRMARSVNQEGLFNSPSYYNYNENYETALY